MTLGLEYCRCVTGDPRVIHRYADAAAAQFEYYLCGLDYWRIRQMLLDLNMEGMPVTISDSTPAKSPVVGPSKPRLWQVLGPGLITGATDDDPSGIATYAQAGAQFGFGLTWTLLFSYHLMVAIQAISARIGRTTGRGIAGNIRVYYSNWVLQTTVLLLLLANICNIGADLGAMAEASRSWLRKCRHGLS